MSSSILNILRRPITKNNPAILAERRIIEFGDRGVRYWTAKEHDLLLEGLHVYGKDYKQLSEHVGTKDLISVRSKLAAIKK